MPTSLQTPSPAAKLQTINHKLQPLSLPKAIFSRKLNTITYLQSILSQNPAWKGPERRNQTAGPSPTIVDYLLLENPNSVFPNPNPAGFSDNVHPSDTSAQSSSKDTVPPSTLSTHFPPFCTSQPKIPCSRCGRRLSNNALEGEHCLVHNAAKADQGNFVCA
ncbi:hypothetical protein ACTXT7_016928 [Hymenolepis weldensis]